MRAMAVKEWPAPHTFTCSPAAAAARTMATISFSLARALDGKGREVWLPAQLRHRVAHMPPRRMLHGRSVEGVAVG